DGANFVTCILFDELPSLAKMCMQEVVKHLVAERIPERGRSDNIRENQGDGTLHRSGPFPEPSRPHLCDRGDKASVKVASCVCRMIHFRHTCGTHRGKTFLAIEQQDTFATDIAVDPVKSALASPSRLHLSHRSGALCVRTDKDT